MNDETIVIGVDGEVVEGQILGLSCRDLTIAITRPFAGIETSLHIPYFALPYFQFERDGGLTVYGRETAQRLLAGLFEACRNEVEQ